MPGVLMVTGAYHPEVSGGGLQCRTLVRALRGYVPITVLTTATEPGLATVDEVDGVPVYRIAVAAGRPGAMLRALWLLMRRFLQLRRRFDIVHLHGVSRKTLVLIALARLFGKKLVLKLTSAGADDPQSMRAHGRLTFWWYSQPDVFVGVSPRLRDLYAASPLPPARFRLIPNGVDLERFRPPMLMEQRALRRELGLAENVPMILFVGFFSREKRPDVLFDAWTRVVADPACASALVFVGATRSAYHEVDGALAERIRATAAQRGVEKALTFVERTHEIEKYYRAADVFVLASSREGLPNALLEAMATGLPCVASRLPGVTDVVIDHGVTGLLFEPSDIGELEEALRSVLRDRDRAREIGRRARVTIERGHSIADTASRYLDLYRRLAG